MKKVILFLIDAWSSDAGGIQTVNRELCLALGEVCKTYGRDQYEVVCVAKDCTRHEQELAKAKGDVRLLRADMLDDPLPEDRVQTFLVHSSLTSMDVAVKYVVGHSRFTGIAARTVRDAFFKNAGVVVFCHMDIQETGSIKLESVENGIGGEQRFKDSVRHQKLEQRAMVESDIVFAIGPKLRDSALSYLNSQSDKKQKAIELLCGIAQPASGVKFTEGPPVRTFLLIGRTDDVVPKGVDLFAKAAGMLVRESAATFSYLNPQLKFIIRGVPSGETGERICSTLMRMAREAAGRMVTLIFLPYDSSDTALQADMRGATVLVMPSVAEGYGLVAFEAVSLGVPVVVAQESGAGMVIMQHMQHADPARFLVDTKAAPDAAVEDLVEKLRWYIERPVATGRDLGASLYHALSSICSWSKAAETFLTALFPNSLTGSPESNVDIMRAATAYMAAERAYVDNVCLELSGRRLQEIEIPRTLEELNPDPGSHAATINSVEERKNQIRKKPRQWHEITQEMGGHVVRGKPGVGKTTCLLKEVNEWCRKAQHDLESAGVSPDNVGLGLFFHASQLAHLRYSSLEEGLDRVTELVVHRHNIASVASRQWLRRQLKSDGKVFLGIDAIGELDQEQAGNLRNNLDILTVGQSSWLVIMTAGPEGVSQVPSVVSRFWQLGRFTKANIELAAERWLSGNDMALLSFKETLAHDSSLIEMLGNPQLLSLACQAWTETLPGLSVESLLVNRTTLYSRVVARFVERWRHSKLPHMVGEDVSLDFRHFLEVVSYELWELDRYVAASEEEVKGAIDRSPYHASFGLWDIASAGILGRMPAATSDMPFSLVHPELIAYMAASHLARNINDNLNEIDVGFFRDLATRKGCSILPLLLSQVHHPQPILMRFMQVAKEKLSRNRDANPELSVNGVATAIANTLTDCAEAFDEVTLNAMVELFTWCMDQNQQLMRKDAWNVLAQRKVLLNVLAILGSQRYRNTSAELVHRIFLSLKFPLEKSHAVVISNVQQALESNSALVRWVAIWIAAALNDRLQPVMRESFDRKLQEVVRADPSVTVRALSLRALARTAGSSCIPILTKALGEQPQLSASAAAGLSSLKQDEVIQLLKNKVEALVNEVEQGTEPTWIVGSIVGSLANALNSGDKPLSKPDQFSKNEDVAKLFWRLLAYPQHSIAVSAASGLGHMRWTPAWDSLVEVARQDRDLSPDITKLVNTSTFSCWLLSDSLDKAKHESAAHFFLLQALDERVSSFARHYAVLGIATLLSRGYHSLKITDALLRTARNPNRGLAADSIHALSRLDLSEIKESFTLLMYALDVQQRRCVGDIGRMAPLTKTGTEMLLWIMEHEENASVLSSSFQISQAFVNARKAGARSVDADADILRRLGQNAVRLTDHSDTQVVKGALRLCAVMAPLEPLQAGHQLASLRDEMLARVRVLANHEMPDSGVRGSACTALGVLGASDVDLSTLSTLTSDSVERVSKKAADAHKMLSHRLGLSQSPKG